MPCFVSSNPRRRNLRSSCVLLGRLLALLASAVHLKRLRRKNLSPKRRCPPSNTPRPRNQSRKTRWISLSTMTPSGTRTVRHPRLSAAESAASRPKKQKMLLRKVRRAQSAPKCSASGWRVIRRATSAAPSIPCISWIRTLNCLSSKMTSRPRMSSRRRRLNSMPRQTAFTRP